MPAMSSPPMTSWKVVRVVITSEPRSFSTSVRSALVSVSCRTIVTMSSLKYVRARVGPRPVYWLSSRTVKFEIADVRQQLA
jgi:hypothetical protein